MSDVVLKEMSSNNDRGGYKRIRYESSYQGACGTVSNGKHDVYYITMLYNYFYE